MMRGWFTRVTVLADGQELLEEIPAEDAVIPNLAERNLYLQLDRGFSGNGSIGSRGVPVKQVVAPGAQHGDAVPDLGLDVFNKHQQHQAG
ncbi:hypothetical protein HaLaN_19581 [Haematococcus lacustris]|uniref:Uncharacterized protein n=1 Tax=Haematococcus lacustris TaxID=44745 RepID=A0A6A0A0E2_HAELA|nr:hypothetical protein HaLaN_19581 [Haematococcus lacustris]